MREHYINILAPKSDDRLLVHNFRLPECYQSKPILYWLAVFRERVYFINNSSQTLSKVFSDSIGFAADDDGLIPQSPNSKGYLYNDVKPGEAIKVDTFDIIFDSDFALIQHIVIEDRHGELTDLIGGCGGKSKRKFEILLRSDKPKSY